MRCYMSQFIALAICSVLFSPARATKANPELLKEHVLKLTSGPGFRNSQNLVGLNRTADYVHNAFKEYTSETYIQNFYVKGTTYKNVYASFGPVNAPRIIIGAHYDVCGEQKGADDNASGVAGLIELARLFSVTDTRKWKYRIDLVAYSLEEPPYFDTKDMGSSAHAAYLHSHEIEVVGMVCLEMIGYYDDRKKSQAYPVGLLKLKYGSRGDFITVVRKMNAGHFTREFTRHFRHKGGVTTKVFKGPQWLKGVSFSDHINYWKYKWDALMITNTAFYRNPNYHKDTDIPETLNYVRMGYVVTNVYKTMCRMVL